LGSSAGAPLTAKAATFTAVVPTSTPMMTSVVRVFMSLGLDGAGLPNNGLDEVPIAAEPRLQSVQDRRYGLSQLTGIGCLLSGSSSWVLDRSAQPAQMQDPGGNGGGTPYWQPAG
jgi:hypothetical protein